MKKTDFKAKFLTNIQNLQNELKEYDTVEELQISIFLSKLDVKLYKLLDEEKKQELYKKALLNKKKKEEEYLKKKLISYNLNLIKPNFLYFDISKLLLWIENVIIVKLEQNNNKKYYHLIEAYQKEENGIIKKSLLLKIFKKIETYVYYKYK